MSCPVCRSEKVEKKNGTTKHVVLNQISEEIRKIILLVKDAKKKKAEKVVIVKKEKEEKNTNVVVKKEKGIEEKKRTNVVVEKEKEKEKKDDGGTRHLFVDGLGFEALLYEIDPVFRAWGWVESIRIVPRKDMSSSFAFVHYAQKKSATLAMERLKGSMIAGGVLMIRPCAQDLRPSRSVRVYNWPWECASNHNEMLDNLIRPYGEIDSIVPIRNSHYIVEFKKLDEAVRFVNEKHDHVIQDHHLMIDFHNGDSCTDDMNEDPRLLKLFDKLMTKSSGTRKYTLKELRRLNPELVQAMEARVLHESGVGTTPETLNFDRDGRHEDRRRRRSRSRSFERSRRRRRRRRDRSRSYDRSRSRSRSFERRRRRSPRHESRPRHHESGRSKSAPSLPEDLQHVVDLDPELTSRVESESPPQPPPLPKGWKSHVSKRYPGRVYYYNKKTRQRSWTFPTE